MYLIGELLLFESKTEYLQTFQEYNKNNNNNQGTQLVVV